MHPEASEAHAVDQQLLSPAVLPPFPLEQAAGEKAGFGSQLLHTLCCGLSHQLPEQDCPMPLALMVGVAVEQGDTVRRFAHSEGHHHALAQYAHSANAPLEGSPQAVAFGARIGLHDPGMPLETAIKLLGASLHRLAIDLQHCLLISSGQGSQHHHLPCRSVLCPILARLLGVGLACLPIML